ncbi:MAG TPA: diacylglycerol kinase family protein [Ktedonobacterales bacterium]|nr:diacylglycerol kinase family protein [Ktedonobacterales bacterium]
MNHTPSATDSQAASTASTTSTTPAELTAPDATPDSAPDATPEHPPHVIKPGETVLIVNPSARLVGAGNYDATTLERELRERGLDAYLCETTSAMDTMETAKRAAQVGAAMVVAVGGDGTIHTVVDGLVHGLAPELFGAAGVNAGDATPAQATQPTGQAMQAAKTILGIIPAGTMNNVAAALGIPEDTAQALDVLAAGEAQPLDVGLLDGHPFIEVAGFGVVAGLMPLGERVKGRPWVIPAVFSAVVEILQRARPARVRLVLDGAGQWVRALQVTVSNTASYGARFEVAPTARTDDGLLDVTVLIGINGWDVMSHVLGLVGFRTPQRGWRVRRFQARRVIVAPSSPWPSQVDGVHYCVVGYGADRRSLEARALHGVLRVCAPKAPSGAAQPEGAMQTIMRALPTPTLPTMQKPAEQASAPQAAPTDQPTDRNTPQPQPPQEAPQ